MSGQELVTVEWDSTRSTVLDLQLCGIISTRMRHVIKRYLKRIGVVDVDVVHLHDCGELGVRLVAYGRLPKSEEGLGRKIEALEEAVIDTLFEKVDGRIPHPSRADPEGLRRRLAVEEPSMKRVFYKKA